MFELLAQAEALAQAGAPAAPGPGGGIEAVWYAVISLIVTTVLVPSGIWIGGVVRGAIDRRSSEIKKRSDDLDECQRLRAADQYELGSLKMCVKMLGHAGGDELKGKIDETIRQGEQQKAAALKEIEAAKAESIKK